MLGSDGLVESGFIVRAGSFVKMTKDELRQIKDYARRIKGHPLAGLLVRLLAHIKELEDMAPKSCSNCDHALEERLPCDACVIRRDSKGRLVGPSKWRKRKV